MSRRFRRSLATIAAGCTATASFGLGVPSVGAAPPEPSNFEMTLPPEFTFCSYDIDIVVVGKSKTLTKDAFTIALSPGWHATLEANGKTFEFTATGSIKTSLLPDGNTLTEYRGNNLVGDAVAGFQALSGYFTWVSSPSGDSVRPLSGTGRMVDICEALAP